MRRGITTFLLMLCMCWQALAHAGAAVVLADPSEHEHAGLHFEGQGHHHDDDGDDNDVHEDQSLASAQHLASDCGVYAPVLLTSVDLRLPELPPAMPTAVAVVPPPSPFIDGLDRPPQVQS